MRRVYEVLNIIGIFALIILSLLSIFVGKVGDAILSLILARMILSNLERGVKNNEKVL